jgi:hypothetical protein
MATALAEIVRKLASEELTILNEEEAVVFALIGAYAHASGHEDSPLLEFVRELKANKIHIYGRAREDLVSVATAIRVFMQTRGGGQLVKITDKELEAHEL